MAEVTEATETVGLRLKRLRLERKLSQRELAAPGVSYAYISRIEAGTRQPSVKALRQLAHRLGVTASYLETGVETTETDELLIRTVGKIGVYPVTFEMRVGGVGAVAITYEGKEFIGLTFTDALSEMADFYAEVERVRAERARLDAEEAALFGRCA